MKIYLPLTASHLRRISLCLWLILLFFCGKVFSNNLLSLNEFPSIGQETPRFAYRILSLNAGIFNNSFTLSQYNRYSGAFLSEKAKQEILTSIPRQGFWLEGGASLSGLDIIFHNFGLSIFFNSSFILRVPKDVFDLALYGNQMGRRYETLGLKVRNISYWSSAISFNLGARKKLNLKAQVRYLGGNHFFETLETQGYLITTPSFLVSEGSATYRLGRGGSGVGFDLGMGYDFSANLRFALALINLNSGINWTNGPELGNLNFALDSINWERVRSGNFFLKNSQVTQTAPFRTPLPFYINLLTLYQVSPILISRFLLSQSFNESELWYAPTFTATIELRGLGIRQFMLSALGGLSLGGKEGFGFGYGLEIIIKRFSGFIAVKDLGGLFLGAKGTNVSFSFGYNLYPSIKKRPDILSI